jgi:hypothetical protein
MPSAIQHQIPNPSINPYMLRPESVSQRLHKWSMRPTWFKTPALSNCINTKCKKEQEQLNKNKYVIEKETNFRKYLDNRNNIRARFNNNNNNDYYYDSKNNIRARNKDNDKEKREAELDKLYNKDMKEKTKLKLKIMKEKDHNDLLNCRLKKCYKESLNTLKWLIKDILTHADKKTGKYKLALKYKKLLEKNKLEKKKLTREDINAFDIEMVKIILKEHKGKQYW